MDIETMRETDFSADATLERGVLAAKVCGNADLSVGFALERFLQSVHTEACRQHVREVTVDMRALDFMNSSGLKSLVTWVTQIQDLPNTEQYRVTFLSSPQMFWQRRSLYAVSCLADEIVTIAA